MGYFRVTSGVAAVPIPDLGITIPAASSVVLSDQFSINDMYLSADLESLIIASTLAVEIDYGTGYASVAAVDYTNRDALAAFLNVYEITNENNNEKLVNNSEVNSAGPGGVPLHKHDARYYTQTQDAATSNGSSGATLIGVYSGSFVYILGSPGSVQAALNAIDTALGAVTLDGVYINDSDGILNVNGSSKPLIFRSDNVNAVQIQRKSGADIQTLLNAIPGATPSLQLGALVAGALGQVDVRVLSNLIVDGNVTFTGTITDTTVNNLNVTNVKITLSNNATVGANAFIQVQRGSSGNPGSLKWNESTTRWQAGIDTIEQTIALVERNEVITGVWELQGSVSTDPSLYLTDKASAPSTQLGTSTQIGIASIGNIPAIYDKSRSKWIGFSRHWMTFTGRDSASNKAEYARIGLFTSNESSIRLLRNTVLIGMSIQTSGNATWTARVRSNGSVTNLASLAATAAAGAKTTALNVDFNADDVVQVYIDSTSNVNRPVIELEFAPRF